MKNLIFSLLTVTIIIASCSKKDSSSTNRIAGTWIFTNQSTVSYAIPPFSTEGLPVANSSFSTTADSIWITFDNDGHYSFSNCRLPVDDGTFSIVDDSLLVIQPDSADFIKFNYTLPTVSAGTGIPANPVYAPYAGFRFTTDPIFFKKPSSELLTFYGVWQSKTTQVIGSNSDTIIWNIAFNYFKRK